MNLLPEGRDKLYWLLDLFISGHHDVGTFCKEFEQTYNFEVDRSNLSPAEQTVFESLFDKVVVFSPFPEEQKLVPFYVNASEIGLAAKSALETLRAARARPT